MSGLLPTAIAPLFERLCSDVDELMLDANGLQASIGREVGRVLNTRSRLSFDEFSDSTGGVIDYGMPDHSALSPQSDEDMRRLQQAVLQALARYEPRLIHTRVTVSDWPGKPARARITIDASVRLGLEMRRVQFELEVDPTRIQSGAVDSAVHGTTAEA